jgi:hypothetical protein
VDQDADPILCQPKMMQCFIVGESDRKSFFFAAFPHAMTHHQQHSTLFAWHFSLSSPCITSPSQKHDYSTKNRIKTYSSTLASSSSTPGFKIRKMFFHLSLYAGRLLPIEADSGRKDG